jgi:transposase
MIAKKLQVEVKVLARRGKGVGEIARLPGCSRKIGRRALRGKPKAQYGPRPKKLEPYVDYLRDRIDHAKPDRLAGTLLLREIRERGYGSGYSQLEARSTVNRQRVGPFLIGTFDARWVTFRSAVTLTTST